MGVQRQVIFCLCLCPCPCICIYLLPFLQKAEAWAVGSQTSVEGSRSGRLSGKPGCREGFDSIGSSAGDDGDPRSEMVSHNTLQ